MKLIACTGAEYDAPTNTLTARFKNERGEPVTYEIDGLAFAHLMGMANLKNAVIHHQALGKDMPLLPVTGLVIVQRHISMSGDFCGDMMQPYQSAHW